MTYDINPCWLSLNDLASVNLEKTFLMDSQQRERRVKEYMKGYFSQLILVIRKERLLTTLERWKKSHSEYYCMILATTIISHSLLIICVVLNTSLQSLVE